MHSITVRLISEVNGIMRLQGKKIGILIESDFAEYEILEFRVREAVIDVQRQCLTPKFWVVRPA